MNLSKYTMPAEEKRRFNDRPESVRVAIFYEALEIVRKKHGIKIGTDEDERPVLRFRPGFKRKDIGSPRWIAAAQVVDLFIAASNDMIVLARAGKLRIDDEKKSTGPSRKG